MKFHVLNHLEQFTCLVYGHNSESSAAAVHSKLLRKMMGEDEGWWVRTKDGR